MDCDRAQTSHSFMSVSTFVSFVPASTPEPTGLAPRPRLSRSMNSTDENYTPVYLPAGRPSSRIEMGCSNRARTLSSVSNSTWWSAVASVSGHPEGEVFDTRYDREEMKRDDSGVALDSTIERRDSSIRSSCSAASRRQSSNRQKDPSRKSSMVTTLVEQPRISCQSTSASGAPSRRPSTPRTYIPAKNDASPTSTICRFSGAANARPSTSATVLHSAGDPQRPVKRSSWDSAEAITEARRQKRREIAALLSQANSQCELPCTSMDSPPRSRRRQVSTISTSSVVPISPQPGTIRQESDETVSPSPSLLEPTTIAWKNIDTIRAEYAAADRRKRTVWNWIRQRLLCGAGRWGCKDGEFWEEGTDDRSSVRRYRLDLPEDLPEEGEREKAPARVKSVDSGILRAACKRTRRGTTVDAVSAPVVFSPHKPTFGKGYV